MEKLYSFTCNKKKHSMLQNVKKKHGVLINHMLRDGIKSYLRGEIKPKKDKANIPVGETIRPSFLCDVGLMEKFKTKTKKNNVYYSQVYDEIIDKILQKY